MYVYITKAGENNGIINNIGIDREYFTLKNIRFRPKTNRPFPLKL